MNRQFIRQLKKVELHAHINGCVRKATLKEIADREGVPLDLSAFDLRNMTGAFKIFDVIHRVLCKLPDVQRVCREVLEDFKDQGVCYLELRTTPKASCMKSFEYSRQEYIQAILNEIKAFNAAHGEVMQTRLLLSIDRSRSMEDALHTLKMALESKDEGLIVGLDYSGNPSKSSFKAFKQLFETARTAGLKSTIHVAEVAGSTAEAETWDILNFHPDRLGHFNYTTPQQELFVKARNIPIEMCPTSNYFTMNLKSFSEHHFERYFKTGHPLSINTDDTCVFETNPSEEIQRIITSFPLTCEDLRKIQISAAQGIFDENLKPWVMQQVSSRKQITGDVSKKES